MNPRAAACNIAIRKYTRKYGDTLKEIMKAAEC
jgi:hypothetical protein